ncbi:MAG: DUF5681 domain-containing protein [Fluviibacter phosphoraccumulans]
MGFKPGQSGNPKGRPKGSRDAFAAARRLIAPHLPQLAEQTLAAALKGDTNAAVACLELAAVAIADKKAQA